MTCSSEKLQCLFKTPQFYTSTGTAADCSWIAVLELAAGAHGDLLDRIGSLTHGTAETKQL